MPRDSYFKSSWLDIPEYKGWLRKKDDKNGWCNYCKKVVTVTNGGETAIKRHAMGKTHKAKNPVEEDTKQQSIKMHVTSVSSESSECVSSSESVSEVNLSEAVAGSSKSKSKVPLQCGINNVFMRHHVTDAEIRWCLKIVESRISQRSCDDVVALFCTMFSDSEIVKKMTLGRTKCGYVITHGIAPYCEEVLLSEVDKSPFYGLSFDECLNKHLQKGQMDILVRYWNDDENMAETRYLTSKFLGGANAEQILSTFEEGVKDKLNKSEKMLQISSDGPNVNLSFLKKYDEKRGFEDLPPLLNLGTCGLHTVHGSLKNGIKSTDWVMGKVLKAMYKILHDCPARRDIFESITETNIYPLPYCGHRWCENENCIERAEQIWPAMVKFIRHINTLPKSKQPGSGKAKCFIVLTKAVEDPLMQAKMAFIGFIANKLNAFLRGFQTDQPMVPFLSETLGELLKSLLSMFVNSNTLANADTILKLTKLDVKDKGIHKSYKNCDVGMAAKMYVNKYRHSSIFNENALKRFFVEAQTTLSMLTSHMLEKCPLKYPLVRFAVSINPSVILHKSEIAKKAFDNLLEKLISYEKISSKEGNEAKEQFQKLITDILPAHKEKFSLFDKYKDRLDTFYSQFLTGKEYCALWKIFKLVLCLSHGQSQIERGFKTNKEFIVENQEDYSLIALRKVQDHMRSKKVTAQSISITKDLRVSVGKAHQKYLQFIKEKKSVKIVSEKDLKRKVIREEIQEVQKKKMCLEASIVSLRKDADKCAIEAQEKKDFAILERSNDLRSLIGSKKKEIDELDKMEQKLILRKDSII